MLQCRAAAVHSQLPSQPFRIGSGHVTTEQRRRRTRRLAEDHHRAAESAAGGADGGETGAAAGDEEVVDLQWQQTAEGHAVGAVGTGRDGRAPWKSTE